MKKFLLALLSLASFATDLRASETLECAYNIVYRDGTNDETGTFSAPVTECLEGMPCSLKPVNITTRNTCLSFFSQTTQNQDSLAVSFAECGDKNFHRARAKKDAHQISVGSDVGILIVWIDCNF